MTHKVFSLLNYVGHKSKILDQIMIHFPQTLTGTFWDIFSGSCVVGLSSGYQNVHFVDNNKYLQALYTNLKDPNFLSTLETMITNYGLTNSFKNTICLESFVPLIHRITTRGINEIGRAHV